MFSSVSLCRLLSNTLKLRLIPSPIQTSVTTATSHFHSLEAHSEPDPSVVAVTLLESCENPTLLPQIHAHMVRNDLLHSPFHWNSLLRSHLRLGLPHAVLRLYALMSRAGAFPDSYTLPIAFKAVSHSFALATGRQLHAVAAKHGLARDEFTESGIISFYTKAGQFDDALKLFDENPVRKLGSWNAVINGLTQGGHSKEAVDLFIELRRSGSVPDAVTMVSVTSACGSIGDIHLAQQVHKCVFQARRTETLELMVSNSLIDMYAKCGRTDLAHLVFARMARRDVSSWTTMIMGFATHGHSRRALDLFWSMVEGDVRPNHVTFVGVLAACTHGGLADEGLEYLEVMEKQHGIRPTVAHYGCAVDMLGRVGRLEEARAMVERMPMDANAVIWGTLLGACEKHGEVVIGEWAAGKLIELEPWNDGVYVVLSNIYAGVGMWREVERVRRLMREMRVPKLPGFSSATISN